MNLYQQVQERNIESLEFEMEFMTEVNQLAVSQTLERVKDSERRANKSSDKAKEVAKSL